MARGVHNIGGHPLLGHHILRDLRQRRAATVGGLEGRGGEAMEPDERGADEAVTGKCLECSSAALSIDGFHSRRATVCSTVS